MAQTLQQRQLTYENSYSQNIIPRIPVIIKIDGRSFSRSTKHVQKPFCHKTSIMLNNTMINVAKQIDGAICAYQYSDKIILVLRNDRSVDEKPWFGNDVQSMCSATASMVTYEFLNQLWDVEEPPSLEGTLSFKVHVFGVPSIKEAINYLIYRQGKCTTQAVNEAVKTVLFPRYGKETNVFLEEKNFQERKDILKESGLDFESLPSAFRNGTIAYMAPELVETSQGQISRRKWLLDFDFPLFEESQDRLHTILATGGDIFRPERDLE